MLSFKAVAIVVFRAPRPRMLVPNNEFRTLEFAQDFRARASLIERALLVSAFGLLFSQSLEMPTAQAFTGDAVLVSCRPIEAIDMLPGETCLCSAEGLDSIPTPEWYLGHLERLHAAGAMSSAELRVAIDEAASACASSPGTVKRAIAEIALRPTLPTGVTLPNARRTASKSR